MFELTPSPQTAANANSRESEKGLQLSAHSQV